MENHELQQWALNLIRKINKDWKNIDSYSLFYSPVYFKPDLIIIGDNPGGTEKNKQTELPFEHEYFAENYKIAKIMRDKIFKGAQLNLLLKNSVKINRIFIKSQKLSDFSKQENSLILSNYCFEMVEEIIEKLKPKSIFAESFGTFRKFSRKEKVLLEKQTNKGTNKALVLMGYYKNIEIIGINHPSRASFHGINDNDWNNVNMKLTKIFSSIN